MISILKQLMPQTNSIDIRTQPPLTLAYIGDSVIDLLVRTYLSTTSNEAGAKLNSNAIKVVNAGAQARSLEAINEILTEEERDIVRRGRNAKTSHIPKHANISDYKLATGLEALFGYLFLMEKEQRICELFSAIIENNNSNN